MPNCQIDFLGLLEEGQRQIEKGEHDKQDKPGMSQELDDFISSEKSENTLKKTHYQWKKLKCFLRSRPTETLMRKTYLLMLLTNSLENFSKMSVNKMAASMSQTAFQVFKEAFSVNILKDKELCLSREILAAKRKNLVKQGRGNKPNSLIDK